MALKRRGRNIMYTNRLIKTEPALPTPLSVFEGSFGFPLFHRLRRELDDMFKTFGIDRSLAQPVDSVWTPEIEMFTKNHELVVRADVPGLKKEDLTIELTEDALILKGERKHEK